MSNIFIFLSILSAQKLIAPGLRLMSVNILPQNNCKDMPHTKASVLGTDFCLLIAGLIIILEAVSVYPNIIQAELVTHIGITSDGICFTKNLKEKVF